MKIVILAVGPVKTDIMQRGIDEYLRRASRYQPVEMIVVPDVKSARSLTESVQKQKEGEMISAALQPGDFVVLLDERGREQTSREFADFIGKKMVQGFKRLVFVVGGPYGFSDQIYSRADTKLSLSRMTFTHEMVRLFFVEQIYRAMTILRGEPYHHD